MKDGREVTYIAYFDKVGRTPHKLEDDPVPQLPEFEPESECTYSFAVPAIHSSSAPGAMSVSRTTESETEIGMKTGADTVSERARADFSGVWKRIKTINFDAYVGAQGAGTYILYCTVL